MKVLMFDHIYRLNPIFEITPVEKLTDSQKTRFSRVLERKRIHALLIAPDHTKITVKTLGRDIADFLQHLREPKRITDLPDRFNEGPEAERKEFIAKLVLDTVLEVQGGDGFISGVEAVSGVLFPSTATARRSVGDTLNRIQSLSLEAIGFVLESAAEDPRDISAFLYNFNRLPLCTRWRERFPDEEAVAGFLDLSSDNTWTGMPGSVRMKSTGADAPEDTKIFDLFWRYWTFREQPEARETLNHKIYVSPLPEDLPAVFGIVRKMAAEGEAHSMKIGRHVTELLRSDKLIIYFAGHGAAIEFAAELAGKLARFEGQGVPFSYQPDRENPIVSVGVDPPKRLGERNSWRRYITDRLALAVQDVRRTGTGDRIGRIRTYMRMHGIDIDEWRPASNDWSVPFEQEEQILGEN